MLFCRRDVKKLSTHRTSSPLCEQPLAQGGPDEAGAAGDHYAFHISPINNVFKPASIGTRKGLEDMPVFQDHAYNLL